MSLVLSRKVGESVRVGNAIISIRKCSQNHTKLAIEAPRDVEIIRSELDSQVDKPSDTGVEYESEES